MLIFTGARRLKFTTAAICSISEAATPYARSANSHPSRPVRQSYRNHLSHHLRCPASRLFACLPSLQRIQRLGNICRSKAVVIVIAPGQGTAASGFITSIEANMKGFSKPTTSRLSRSCPRAAISLSFSCGLAIPPFVSPLAFWNLMTPIPTAESSNIKMKTKMANSPSTMSLAS